MFLAKVTVPKARIHQFNPLGKTFSVRGECFKCEGSEVQVEPVQGNSTFVRIVEGNKPTNRYLLARDVAALATT